MHKHNNVLTKKTREENDGFNENWISERGFVHNTNMTSKQIFGEKADDLQYNGFQTVWLRNIDRLMRFLIDYNNNIDFLEYSLVDIGSGTGISTIYFSEKFNFKKLIGIEHSEELVFKSLENLKTYEINCKKSSPIEFINADATTYEFPNEKLILFMFNSLKWAPLSKLLARNFHTLSENNSFFLQSNDHCINEVLEHSTLINRDSQFNISAVIF